MSHTIQLSTITDSATCENACNEIKKTFILPDYEVVNSGIGEYFIGSKRIVENTYEVELHEYPEVSYLFVCSGSNNLFITFHDSLQDTLNSLLNEYLAQFTNAITRGVICPTRATHVIRMRFDVNFTWLTSGTEKATGKMYITFEEK